MPEKIDTISAPKVEGSSYPAPYDEPSASGTAPGSATRPARLATT